MFRPFGCAGVKGSEGRLVPTAAWNEGGCGSLAQPSNLELGASLGKLGSSCAELWVFRDARDLGRKI